MQVHRIRRLNALVAAEIAVLCARIDGLKLDAYIQNLYDIAHDDTHGLFGLWSDGVLVGFIQAEAPCPWLPGEGWVHMAAIRPGTPRDAVKTLQTTVESFLRAKGSLYYLISTERKIGGFKRLYGLQETNINVLRKEL